MAVALGMNELAMVLEMTRARAELTQEYMAKRCGCSQTMIALVEKGERDPSLKMLRVYAEETSQSALIGLASGAYVGNDETQLVSMITESVKFQVAMMLMGNEKLSFGFGT